MSLNELRRGQSATITNVPGENLRIQLLRFGIIKCTQVPCHCKLPFGLHIPTASDHRFRRKVGHPFRF